jgi:CheY-like chemotaxis protein
VDRRQGNGAKPEPFRAAYRFLVVEDNFDSAMSMQLLLQLLGGEVRVAYDGIQALQLAEEFQPHAVLLDIGLPQVDGYEVARRMRGKEWGKNMIVLAVSGWCRNEDRQHALEAGFDAHLPKPVGVELIRETLQTLLDGRNGAAKA